MLTENTTGQQERYRLSMRLSELLSGKPKEQEKDAETIIREIREAIERD